MDTTIGIFLAIIIFLIVYFIVYNFQSDLVYVKSFVDNQSYLVRELPDKQQAADLLASTKKSLLTIVNKLDELYPNKKKVQLLVKRYRPDELSEVQTNSSYTSYSVNKGEKIIFCLRSRDENEKLVSKNTILFVALHELAHVMTISVGHTEEFWDNFRFLLAHAIHWKIYKPVNFRAKPQPYCGTFITDTPLKLKDMKKYIKYEEVDDVMEEENDASIYSA